MLESIKKMFDSLHSNNILYCHWKSNEHLEPALNGDTDLDMLFQAYDRSKLDIILNECGLKRFRSTPLSQYNAIEDYIGFDKKEAKIWHLHLHYQLTIGENHLKGYTLGPWSEYILNNRIIGAAGVYTACPEDELILLYIRMALKFTLHSFFSSISRDDSVELKWLKERIDIDKFVLHAKDLLGKECCEKLLVLVNKDLCFKRELLGLGYLTRKRLQCFTGNSLFVAWLRRECRTANWIIGGVNHRLGFNSSKPYSRVSPAGGCTIAFLGSDGAGKSTTIKYIRDELTKKLDVKIVYLGSGDGSSSLIRKPMKMVAKRVGGRGLGSAVEKEYKEANCEQKRVSLKAQLYSIAKFIWAMTLAREKQFKLREITKARNNGMIVLLDRYPQSDFFGVNDGPLLHKYIDSSNRFLKRKALYEQKIYEMFKFNPPDLVIKLVVPIEVAMQRKPEMTADELKRKLDVVMSMEISPNCSIIDTSRDKKTTFGEIMEKIWLIV